MTSNEQFGSGYPMAGIPVGEPYPEGGYVPPDRNVDFVPSPPGESSTAQVAKDQAASVAGGAADAAQHVAEVAKDQVGAIAAEGGRQARQLLGQAQSELSEQAQVQQQRVAGGLRALGDQLSSMAQGSQEQGVATDLAHQAADKAHEVAGWLEGRDPGAVLDEVRSFARRRPGTFLAIAVGAGLVTGRLVRGLTADADTTGSSTPGAATPGYPAVGSSAGIPVLGGGPAPLVYPGPPAPGGAAGGEVFAEENPYRVDQQADWADRPADTPGTSGFAR